MTIFSVRSRLIAVAGAVALAASLGGVALAASSASSSAPANPIKGCYVTSSGALSVLTAHHKTCGRGAHSISWNSYASVSMAAKIESSAVAFGPKLTQPGVYSVTIQPTVTLNSTDDDCVFFAAKTDNALTNEVQTFVDVTQTGAYEPSFSGMVTVTKPLAGAQLEFACSYPFLAFLAISSAEWYVAPIGVQAGTSAAVAPAAAHRLSKAALRKAFG